MPFLPLGGQAVIEGVMMRSPSRVAVAVRRPDGSLAFFERPFESITRRVKLLGLPVVRERDFRTAKTQLLDAPVDPHFRLTFRLYSINAGAADYAIRIYDENTSALLGSTTAHVVSPSIPKYQLVPGYLQLGDLLAVVPAGVALPEAVRVEIEPLTAGSAFWAFVSVTNNDTQQLTVIAPQ